MGCRTLPASLARRYADQAIPETCPPGEGVVAVVDELRPTRANAPGDPLTCGSLLSSVPA